VFTHAQWLQSLLAPLAPFYPYAVFGAGVLLGWRLHRSRLLFALLVLALADRTLLHFAGGHGLARDRVVYQAIALLLPLNFAALAGGTLVRLGPAPGVHRALGGAARQRRVLDVLSRHRRAHPDRRRGRSLLPHGLPGQPHGVAGPARPQRSAAAARRALQRGDD